MHEKVNGIAREIPFYEPADQPGSSVQILEEVAEISHIPEIIIFPDPQLKATHRKGEGVKQTEMPITDVLFRHDFDTFYTHTQPKLVAFLSRFTHSYHDAEQLAHEVILKLGDNIESYDETKGSFMTWTLTIASHLAIDTLRREKRRPLTAPDVNPEDILGNFSSQEGNPEEEVIASLRSERIHEALQELGEDSAIQKEAIELVYFQGKTHLEAAAAVGVPVGTIKTRLRLGKAKLTLLLKDEKNLLFE